MSHKAEPETHELAVPPQSESSNPLKRKHSPVVVSVDQSDIINPSGRFPYSVFPVYSVMERLCIVDKTQHIQFFIKEKNVVVLRPRRFGKSMWLSTLKHFFEDPRAFIDRKLRISNISFNTYTSGRTKFVWKPGTHEHNFPPCPVILIDFSTVTPRTRSEYDCMLGDVLMKSYTGSISAVSGLKSHSLKFSEFKLERKESSMRMLFDLIHSLASRSTWGKVVVLIDEYNHCLVKHSGTPSEYEEVRRMHCEFFTLLKAVEPFTLLQFVMGTNYRKIEDVLYSGSHLRDRTLDPRIATLFGFTQSEVDVMVKGRRLPEGFAEGMKKRFKQYCFNTHDASLTVYNSVTIRDAVERGLLMDWAVGRRTSDLDDDGIVWVDSRVRLT